MKDPVETSLTRARKLVETNRRVTTAAENALYQAIVDAVAAGWTHARIAEAVGFTKARVTQIANGKARRI